MKSIYLGSYTTPMYPRVLKQCCPICKNSMKPFQCVQPAREAKNGGGCPKRVAQFIGASPKKLYLPVGVLNLTIWPCGGTQANRGGGNILLPQALNTMRF